MRVLEFVGLPWDENCLQFYKNDRLLKTASVAQMRRPIYKTSVARWKHFARYLQPLHDIVKPWQRQNDFRCCRPRHRSLWRCMSKALR